MNLPIKVISLERTPERRAIFAQTNSHIDYAFVDAVDGKALSAQQLHDKTIIDPEVHAIYRPGAFGCALSHLHLWNSVISEQQAMTIAEDDAVFRLDFMQQSSALLAQLPEDWDIVLWGWNMDTQLSVHALPSIAPVMILTGEQQLRKNIHRFQQLHTPSMAIKLDIAIGTLAYSMSVRGAKKFKQYCFPLIKTQLFSPMHQKWFLVEGIDMVMCKFYSSTNAFVAFPPLAVSRNEQHTSTIKN